MLSRISAAKLQDICIQSISSNIYVHCYQTEDGQMKFRYQDIFLHADLADGLLHRLSDRRQIDNVLLSLFADPNTTQLKRVHLRNANISPDGLSFLKNHKLKELDMSVCSSRPRAAISGNDILEALAEWTLEHLQVLNCSGVNPFMNYRHSYHVSEHWNLQSLLHLNISKTDTDNTALEALVNKLPKLELLDISHTHVTDISCLQSYQSQLKSLTMSDVRLCAESFTTLIRLKKLRHLDISRRADQDSAKITDDKQLNAAINSFLEDGDCLPCVRAVDLSGWECIEADILQLFLSKHADIQFIGLMLTTLCNAEYLCTQQDEKVSHLQVTGTANEAQLIAALNCYTTRCNYAHKALFHLFAQSSQDTDSTMLKAVFETLRNFPSHLGIQMAGSATMFNLMKGDLSSHLHVSILSQLIDLTLAAMKTFPYSQQLQKNCLLIIYNDTVLKDVIFDRYVVASLSMQCLHIFDDNPMKTMAVYILSEAALKINTPEIEKLGNRQNMKKLLEIIREKIEARQVDYALKFTLSALWNLTDECPSSCSTFLQEMGLEIFLEMLEVFPDEDHLQTKVLGLLNNVAEVKELRKLLIKKELIEQLNNLLESPKIEVSYFAAGVVSHIISADPSIWTLPLSSRDELIQCLYNSVNGWEIPTSTVVAYRSFIPFFSLLRSTTSAAQLWALWAILYVCSIHGDRYCSLLISDGGLLLLKSLHDNPSSDVKVKEIAAKILCLLKKYIYM